MIRVKNIVMSVVVALFIVIPVPSKAFVFMIPAVIEGGIALLTSSEAAYIAITGGGVALAGRETLKQGSKYVAKKSVNAYVKPLLVKKLVKSLGHRAGIAKDIKFSKIVFSSSYVPKAGKQLLYYISLKHGGKKYYKIGITRNSLKMRYRREYHSASIDPVLMLEMPMKTALGIETAIKASFLTERTNNRAILAKDGGYSEVYGRDILEMDGLILSAIKWIE